MFFHQLNPEAPVCWASYIDPSYTSNGLNANTLDARTVSRWLALWIKRPSLSAPSIAGNIFPIR